MLKNKVSLHAFRRCFSSGIYFEALLSKSSLWKCLYWPHVLFLSLWTLMLPCWCFFTQHNRRLKIRYVQWIPTGRKYLFCNSISDTVCKNVIECQLGTWKYDFFYFTLWWSVYCCLWNLDDIYVDSSSEDNGYRMDDNVLLRLSKNFWNFVDGEGVKNSLSTNFQEKWILKVFFCDYPLSYFNFFLATSFEKTPLLNSFCRFLLQCHI